MPALHELPATELVAGYRRREVSPVEVTRAVLDHIERWEPHLQALFLLRPERADDGAARPTRFEAVNRGWVSITRPWHLVSKNTGLGDPAAATADKGHKLMDILVDRLGGFLVDLAKAEVDERFPF